jgi:hypothetical protein
MDDALLHKLHEKKYGDYWLELRTQANLQSRKGPSRMLACYWLAERDA